MRDFGGFDGLRRVEWFLGCCGVESGGRKCLGRVEWLRACWLAGVLLVESPSRCRITLPVVWLMRGFAGFGRLEVSGEGGMVGGVLVTRGFAGKIALPVQNHPPGAE